MFTIIVIWTCSVVTNLYFQLFTLMCFFCTCSNFDNNRIRVIEESKMPGVNWKLAFRLQIL